MSPRYGGRRGSDEDDSAVDRIITALERWPAGMHDLGEPTIDLPTAWPPSVMDVYLAMGGARMFGDALVLKPPAEVGAPGDDGRYEFGEIDGEPIWFDTKGRVWREDPDTGERIVDGTSFDRWLHGAVDATALLFDDDGEYAEAAFTEDGELTDETALARVRSQVKRDGRAPGPRWRLARLLAAGDDLTGARRELEEVVTQAPTLPWAWLDLARISERLGDLPGALDEAIAAADADPKHEQRPYFLAEAARLAAAAGDEPRRAGLAQQALALDPGLVRAQVTGAEDRLTADELDAAAHLIGLARTLAPRDLAVLDLARRIDDAKKSQQS